MRNLCPSVGTFLLAIILLAAPASAQAFASDPESDGFFWGVLDGVAFSGGTCQEFAGRLERSLSGLSNADLTRFAGAWARWWHDSYRWDLWGAAYLINGGASDDGFNYFRGWLLTRGSDKWDHTSRDPDSAFDDVQPGTMAECEDVLRALPTVYEARFQEGAPEVGNREPLGTAWTEQDLPKRFPRLSHRFAGS